MLIRLTQRRSAGAGLCAARYLGAQIIGAGPPRGLQVPHGRGNEPHIDNSGEFPMASVTTNDGFR